LYWTAREQIGSTVDGVRGGAALVRPRPYAAFGCAEGNPLAQVAETPVGERL
jgi:hypothetical protein